MNYAARRPAASSHGSGLASERAVAQSGAVGAGRTRPTRRRGAPRRTPRACPRSTRHAAAQGGAGAAREAPPPTRPSQWGQWASWHPGRRSRRQARSGRRWCCCGGWEVGAASDAHPAPPALPFPARATHRFTTALVAACKSDGSLPSAASSSTGRTVHAQTCHDRGAPPSDSRKGAANCPCGGMHQFTLEPVSL